MKRVSFSLLTVGLLVIGGLLLNGCAGNRPPVAVIAVANIVNLTVYLDGTGSHDWGTDTIVGYLWEFGDGVTCPPVCGGIFVPPASSGNLVGLLNSYPSWPNDWQQPTHTYAAAGTYTVTLTVVDDYGATGTDSVEVTVPPAP